MKALAAIVLGSLALFTGGCSLFGFFVVLDLIARQATDMLFGSWYEIIIYPTFGTGICAVCIWGIVRLGKTKGQ